MAPIHISKDPPEQTVVAFGYGPLLVKLINKPFSATIIPACLGQEVDHHGTAKRK
jgi:hypothetical protein